MKPEQQNLAPTPTVSHARHWAVLLGCCLLFGFVFTIPMHSFGVFLAPIVEYFQCSTTEVSIYFTFTAVAAAFSSALGSRILKYSMRLTVVVASLCICFGYIALSVFPAVPMVWIAGVVAGLCFPLCTTVLIPIVINAWFAKNQGTFIGLAFAMVGVFGMVFSMLFTALIAAFGWQAALRIAACMVACAGILVTIFLLRESPASVGCRPYGETETAHVQQAVQQENTSNMLRMPAFWFCAFACFFSGFLGDFNAQLNVVSQKSGFDAVTAGLALSCAAAGLMLGKLLMGWVKDKFGSAIAVAEGCVVGVVAFVLFLLGIVQGNIALLYTGAFLTGFCTCLGTLTPTLLASEAFSPAAYARVVSYTTAFCSFGMAVGIPFYSLTFDTLHTYVPILVACVLVPLVVFALSLNGIRKGKRFYNNTETKAMLEH